MDNNYAIPLGVLILGVIVFIFRYTKIPKDLLMEQQTQLRAQVVELRGQALEIRELKREIVNLQEQLDNKHEENIVLLRKIARMNGDSH